MLTPPSYSGNVDLSELLDIMDHRFVKAKEQASSGRDILDRVEKWERASEEEKWLDDYEKDDNRYSAGRGAHEISQTCRESTYFGQQNGFHGGNLEIKNKSLGVGERNPIPAQPGPAHAYLRGMHDAAAGKRSCKTQIGGMHKALIAHFKLQEQKRLQEQLTTEQEATYGSRSSSAKKPLNLSINTNNLPGTHPSVLEGQPPGAMDSPSSQAERTVPEPTP
ncbi:hypothetical protein SAY87_009760 [Trapa incisa]|uniref:Uncharacterized protein n=1 Tax=Trapa incisa TaxID=236973 RepID=A0AAN7PYI3_9MYRT|nr:hypothetical protein SAY87_009760 [Trapa incisa]